jgi:predicted RNase H-like HicB family nuclease
MRRTIRAFISKGESQFVAECVDVNVVTQGRTIDEAVQNLQEAVALFLEGEDLEELGFALEPSLLITMEIEPLSSDAASGS